MKASKIVILIVSSIISHAYVFSQDAKKTPLLATMKDDSGTYPTFNKSTGKQMILREMVDLLENYRNILKLTPVVDEYGKKLRYEFDPKDPVYKEGYFNEICHEEGVVFPNFIVKTFDNDTINLEEQKGKFVILRFISDLLSFKLSKNKAFPF